MISWSVNQTKSEGGISLISLHREASLADVFARNNKRNPLILASKTRAYRL
jgi:hypothetical protein